MTETKKKKMIIGLVAAVLIVVFFFAGFGAGYSTGKGADSAPDAVEAPAAGLYVEDSTSDGLKVATLSATKTVSSAASYGFDYFNSPLQKTGRDTTPYYTSFYFSDYEGEKHFFPFDSFTFLEVAYSNGTPIESTATIEWTLTCEDGSYGDYGENWRELLEPYFYFYESPMTLDDVFFDLAIYEDDAHVRLGCKMPFFFPVTLGVKVTTKDKKSYSAELNLGYRKARALRSGVELEFDGIASPVASWGVSTVHVDYDDFDYIPLRIPIYSYAVVTGTDTVSTCVFRDEENGMAYFEGDEARGEVADAVRNYFRYSYSLTACNNGVYRLGSGLRYFAAFAAAGYFGIDEDWRLNHSDPANCYGCLETDFDFWELGYYGPFYENYDLWTDDPESAEDGKDFYLPLLSDSEMTNFYVLLGPGFNSGGLYETIGDPYEDFFKEFEEAWGGSREIEEVMGLIGGGKTPRGISLVQWRMSNRYVPCRIVTTKPRVGL